ncbi:MAG: 5-demethoxyubiquinol-8 5-hydroxylase UbiM [Ideonella sp.]|nr:5-demethoxyubiquinol-8 5-hydroxylase UbiM [Ideonella sp.]
MPETTLTPPPDLLIIGAGPAGLALACAVADAGLRAHVLEQQARAALEHPAEDGRDIALTHRSRSIMQALGLWQRLPVEHVAPLREARVLDGDSPDALRFASIGKGDESLGWLVPNHLIRQAALEAALARPGVRLQCDARVAAVQCGAGGSSVTLADGQRLGAPLVVAADSRLSLTRRMAGIGASMHDFGRSVVVGRVAHEGDNQGIAWECFRYGNTLALLPMNDRQCSAVVTLPSDKAPEWLALSDEDFAARIQAQTGGKLGTLRAAGARHHYPLVGVYAHRFAAAGFALIGDAAVGMHPVTAHGYNFGLYGVEVLTRELAQARKSGRALGALPVLQAYEREHRRTTLPVYLGTNAVVALFTDERSPARLARRAVLAVAERAPGLSGVIKHAITRQLMGGAARAT